MSSELIKKLRIVKNCSGIPILGLLYFILLTAAFQHFLFFESLSERGRKILNRTQKKAFHHRAAVISKRNAKAEITHRLHARQGAAGL
jgi:hypothetical protein